MLVTVISPAVNIATQTAARPKAGQHAGNVTRQNTCHGVPSSRACSSSAGSTIRSPRPANKHNPGDGSQGVDPNGRVPAAKPRFAAAMGRVPSLLPEAGLPGTGLQVERQKEQHHDDAYSRPPARQIAPQQQPCHCGSQGQAEGQGLQRKGKRIDYKRKN